MKCSKCNKENIYKAKFCMYCGNEFSSKEREMAYDNSLVGKLNDIKDKLSLVSNSKFSDNIFYKIILLLVAVLPGIILYNINGNKLRIEESSTYSVSYNESSNEYYVTTNLDVASIDFYIPRSIETLNIEKLDSNGNSIDTYSYNEDNLVEFEALDGDAYYIITVNYKNNTTDTLKIYVYRKA